MTGLVAEEHLWTTGRGLGMDGRVGTMRLVVILLVFACLAGPAGPAAGAGHRSDVTEALRVLHDWDTRRAATWADGDERGLRTLYLPGSSAARADVRLLRTYTARGLVVRRLVTQVFGVRVLRREPARIVIRVLDRVAGGRVLDGDTEVALPSSRPVLRRIEFRRVLGRWKVAAVTR